MTRQTGCLNRSLFHEWPFFNPMGFKIITNYHLISVHVLLGKTLRKLYIGMFY